MDKTNFGHCRPQEPSAWPNKSSKHATHAKETPLRTAAHAAMVRTTSRAEYLLLLLLASASSSLPLAASNAPTDLSVDLKPSPSMGVDARAPRFDWITPHLTACDNSAAADPTTTSTATPPPIDQLRVAYQLQIALVHSGFHAATSDSPAQHVWDSGKVMSTSGADGLLASPVRPLLAAGASRPLLRRGTPYTWRVRVWVSATCSSAWSAPAKFVANLGDVGVSFLHPLQRSHTSTASTLFHLPAGNGVHSPSISPAVATGVHLIPIISWLASM